jgi:hypothetical protein
MIHELFSSERFNIIKLMTATRLGSEPRQSNLRYRNLFPKIGFNIRLCLTSNRFPGDLTNKMIYAFFLPHTCYMSIPTQAS